MTFACQVECILVSWSFVSHSLKESLCLLMGKPSGPNLLDKPLKGFIVNPADLPRLWVKRLISSGERVNHDSHWKCTTTSECKTTISAVLTVTSGLGPLRNRWWTLMIRMMKTLTNDYCLWYSLFMFTWSCVYMGLWINLLPPYC
jgi:hypothetical protein